MDLCFERKSKDVDDHVLFALFDPLFGGAFLPGPALTSYDHRLSVDNCPAGTGPSLTSDPLSRERPDEAGPWAAEGSRRPPLPKVMVDSLPGKSVGKRVPLDVVLQQGEYRIRNLAGVKP